jgi:hypothetical protein
MRIIKLLFGLVFILVATSFVILEDDFIQILVKRMHEYKQRSPRVKVFLSFNQNIYAPGDTAFFVAHFLSDDLLPVAGRNVLQVELVDHSGKVIMYHHIAIKDGVGTNQLVIPSDLSAGIYQWISYNEYMKNFDPHFYFRQDFDLVTKSELKREVKNDLSINVFPEGGTFVESIQNNVIAVTKDPSITGFKIFEDGILKVQDSITHGLGASLVTPQRGKKYVAEFESGTGQTKRINLPKVQPKGYSIAVSGSDPIQVVVRASNETRAQKEALWLVVSAQSEIFYSAPFKFSETEQVTVKLPSKDLPSGIAQITLFNDKGVVYGERLFFNHIKAPVTFQLSKDKSSYINRSRVSLDVELIDDLGNPLSGNFSISVLNKKFSNTESSQLSIISYLSLYSDLITQENFSDFTDKELDLFLITQPNRTLDWVSIFKEEEDPKSSAFKRSESPKYPFRNMVYYSGQAINVETGLPVPDSTRIITYLQNNMMGYETYTNRNGWFDLVFLFDFMNVDKIFYMMENKNGREINGRIKWDEDSVQLPTSYAKESSIKSAYAEYQTQKKSMDQSYNFYSSNKSSLENVVVRDPNADFEDEMTEVDVSVKVQDYVVFPTMEEMIREIIPYLQHRKVGDRTTVRVVLFPNNKVPAYDPLFLIDGIMTKSTAYFLSLNPSEIISIKLIKDINKLNRFGSLGKNGIVLVYTKKESHPELQKINTQLEVKGLNKPYEHYSPTEIDRFQVRKPDFRSTLYWNPNVQVDASGKANVDFYTSDDVGTFLIRIQGITSDGRPFEKTDSLTVSFSGN